MEKGVPVRSLSRGIAVLQAINRGGSLTMMEIARTSGIPYPTACRIVQTLLFEGLVEQEPARKYYRPTALVQTLAQGFQEQGQLVQIARPKLVELTHALGWPISLSTAVGPSMVIRDSTHSITALTFSQYHPGYSLPILECASGLAYLAFSAADHRRRILETLRRTATAQHAHMINVIANGARVEEIRAQGFASRGNNRFTRDPGRTSSIAVPIMQSYRVLGVLTLAFFSSSMAMQQAVDDFVEPLKEAARHIASSYPDDTIAEAAA